MAPEPIAYLNGRFGPFSLAALPLNDAGFVHGAVVTDRWRTFRQRFFRLDDHLQRFRESCQLARIPQPLADARLCDVAQELLDRSRHAAAPGEEFSLIVFATPGPVAGFGGEPEAGRPTLGMYAFPLPVARAREWFRTGLRLRCSHRFAPADYVDPRIKHRSRLAWWIAGQEAGDDGSLPLFVTPGPESRVRETAVANFLAVRDGTVVSPPRETVLNGVALAVTVEICRDLRIPFVEREMLAEEIIGRPDECLLTNSSFCVAGVSTLDHTPCPWPGPTQQRLLRAWSERVGVDVKAQFLADR